MNRLSDWFSQQLSFCKIAAFFGRVLILLSLLMATANQGIASAAALELYETGAPDLGTASAGRAAMATDASTAASNPAGLTLLDGTQLMVAAGALVPLTNFNVGSKTTTKGGGGGNAGVPFPFGSFFFAYKYSEALRFGVGSYSDFGLSANYGSQWAGRYYLNRESLVTMKVNPSVAYAANKWLSVGAGFSFAVARMTFKSQINNVLGPTRGDGSMSFESWDEAFAGNAGILVSPTSSLRIGLTYQSPEYFKFGFNPLFRNLGPGFSLISKRIGGVKINIPVEQPQQAMASAFYQLFPRWSLMGNIGWQNWSAFGEFPVGISARNQRTIEANLHFSDTCQIAIGQQFRFAEKWLWSAGFGYDSSSVSETNRSAVLPIDRQLRYATGIEYEINQRMTAGAAWEFADAGPAPLTNNRGPLAGTLQGHYSTNYLNFIALNLNWKL